MFVAAGGRWLVDDGAGRWLVVAAPRAIVNGEDPLGGVGAVAVLPAPLREAVSVGPEVGPLVCLAREARG